jgi:hypothetical protein
MNKLLKKCSGWLLVFVFSTSGLAGVAQASTVNLCRDRGITFAFFNGVMTTEFDARKAMNEFKLIHGNQSYLGEPIRYEYLYNQSNGFEDFVEVFEQRLLEQEGLLEGRFELFFEALKGEGPWWSTIIDSISEAVEVLKGFVDWCNAAIANVFTSIIGNPPTMSDYVEHRSRIDNWVLEGQKLLFVAHSQGNLFANAAYDYALTKTGSDSVKVVHIAPASIVLHGDYTLADLDLVINGLRIAGSVPNYTTGIPGYLERPASKDGQRDILGHGLFEVYINQELDIADRVKNHIEMALLSLEAPPVQAESGFFTVTLTWNGSGDVDLHTYEPNGRHVYYRTPTGLSGRLDVDNTRANGPEHYYAFCDASSLQEGDYKILIANYSRADNRIATVQVASLNDGVLGTKSVVLGSATGSNPAYSMFKVMVTKNENNGRYSVSISD